jgi:hypothetical protein
MPPEYITDGILSRKHDVYAFGVTLLETISGMSRFKQASGQASIEWVSKNQNYCTYAPCKRFRNLLQFESMKSLRV